MSKFSGDFIVMVVFLKAIEEQTISLASCHEMIEDMLLYLDSKFRPFCHRQLLVKSFGMSSEKYTVHDCLVFYCVNVPLSLLMLTFVIKGND